MNETIFYPDYYFLYTRRSTDDKVNQKNSIKYQVDQCLRYSDVRHLPIAPVTIAGFVEGGIIRERHSAFKTPPVEIESDGSVRYTIERPKFQRLISLVAERRLRGVICLCLDRLSRNAYDSALIKELRTRGIDIHFVQATYEENSAGALHLDIDSMFASHSSRQSSERIRATYAKLRGEGKCTYRTPLGYLDQGPDNKPMDPARAPIVKRLFELYATGEWSFVELARWGRQQGLTTKPRRSCRTAAEILTSDDDGDEDDSRPQVSLPVTEKTVEHLLRNPFYTGRIVNRGQELPGVHQPLISARLFQKVQQTLLARCTSVHYLEKEFFTYRGLARCVCHRAYSPYRQKGHPYYLIHCRPGCSNRDRNVRETEFDALVVALFGRIYLNDQELAQIEAQAPRRLTRLERDRSRTVADVEQRLTKTERDLAYLANNKITLLREGVFTAGAYTAETNRLEGLTATLSEERNRIGEVSPAEMLKTVLRFSELVKMAQQTYELVAPEKRRRLLVKAVSELVVVDGKLAAVSAKEGFEALSKRHVTASCGPDYVFSELTAIYSAARLSLEASPPLAEVGSSQRSVTTKNGSGFKTRQPRAVE